MNIHIIILSTLFPKIWILQKLSRSQVSFIINRTYILNIPVRQNFSSVTAQLVSMYSKNYKAFMNTDLWKKQLFKKLYSLGLFEQYVIFHNSTSFPLSYSLMYCGM